MPPDTAASDAGDGGASLGVLEPILNGPFEKPKEHWLLSIEAPAKKMRGRRPSLAHPPQEGPFSWDLGNTLKPSETYVPAYEMTLVNLIRQRLDDWRAQNYPGVTRITLELLKWWTREGRKDRLFFAQLEAAETIIFLTEARQDFLQGIDMALSR